MSFNDIFLILFGGLMGLYGILWDGYPLGNIHVGMNSWNMFMGFDGNFVCSGFIGSYSGFMGFYSGSMGFIGMLPSGKTNITM